MKNDENRTEMEEKHIFYLAQWLRENALQRQMEIEPDVTQAESEAQTVRSVADDYDEPIRMGQIRLMARAISDVACRPVYVAVLAEVCDVREWEIAPFSAYSVPAVPGEFLLRDNHDISLRTLCLWNDRAVSQARLSRSWLVDELTAQEQQEVRAVRNYLQKGIDLADDLHARIGTPIVRLDDPRRDYQQEEKQLMDTLSTKNTGTKDVVIDLDVLLNQSSPPAPPLYVIAKDTAAPGVGEKDVADGEPLLKVAEPRAKYDASSRNREKTDDNGGADDE